MPVRPEIDGDPRGLRRNEDLCARTGSRPADLPLRRRCSPLLAAPTPMAIPAGRDPAPDDVPTPTARPCNLHSAAAREAASFNPTLDRARATPAVPLSTPRLRTVFCGLPTRRSAKR